MDIVIIVLIVLAIIAAVTGGIIGGNLKINPVKELIGTSFVAILLLLFAIFCLLLAITLKIH
jgi:DMSO/TMAO reductase YedYZ heme-binding membrane subunit